MLQRGDTFGSYRIVARLRSGGMAQLYLAKRHGAAGFSRPVALKVIHAHLARQEEFVRMFVDEASLSSKVHDPNVVHVEDLGNVNGMLFLAMEYVHGTSLASVLRASRRQDRRLAPALVAHVCAQIASGLHAAHETTDETGQPLGIVHRDVSPHNVLFAFKGHVKVIDFGVAKAYGQQHETHAGAIQGKLGYMPPEQALGERIDRRADVYALGIVLWEMLAGRKLFDADSELALLERVRDPVIDPPSRFADVPPALDAAVMRMLARRVQDRPSTALAVKRMLLDAAPEARGLEAGDLAALLCALVPEEIEQQGRLLASADVDVMTPASPRRVFVHASDLEDTIDDDDAKATKAIDPVEALHQLTVPLVVAPPRASSASRGRPALAAAVGIAAAFAVAAALALVARRSSPPATTEVEVAPPAVETTAAAALASPPSPLPEPAPARAGERPAVAPPAASPATAPATATATATATAAKRAAPRPRAKAPSAPAKPRCVFVEGVELCDH